MIASLTRAPWIRMSGGFARSSGRRRIGLIPCAALATASATAETLETGAAMWPVLIFALLVLAVLADSIWRERRLRQQRHEAKQQFTTQLLAQQKEAFLHAQAQQRALFNSMGDGVLLLDAE